MFDLSVILKATCARSLERSLSAIFAGTTCDYEVLVVGELPDRDLLDHSADALGDRLQVCGRHADDALRRCLGRNVLLLGGDSHPLPGALDRAVELIDLADPAVAFLAMFHRVSSPWNAAYELVRRGQRYHLPHLRGTLVAQVSVGRTDTFARLGSLDPQLSHPGNAVDLSLRAWHSGMRVLPAMGCAVDGPAMAQSLCEADHRTILARWDLPAANLNQNEFDPLWACTLRGLKSASIAA